MAIDAKDKARLSAALRFLEGVINAVAAFGIGQFIADWLLEVAHVFPKEESAVGFGLFSILCIAWWVWKVLAAMKRLLPWT